MLATTHNRRRSRVYDRLRPLVRHVADREQLNDGIDRLRLRFDAFPDGLYQPVPTLGVRISHRATGSSSRWDAMRPLFEQVAPATAVDIGANAGYFSLELAKQDVGVIALEADPANLRTLLLAARLSGSSRLAVMSVYLTPANIDLVPPADATLCLAVWHHFVREHGIEPATRMLEAIWSRTRRMLIFESGPVPEAPDDFDRWLEQRLQAACPAGRLQHLGTHAAANPAAPPRPLYAVVRDG